MLARYCSWCTPRRLLEEIDDGLPGRTETDTACPACAEAILLEAGLPVEVTA